MTYTVRAFRVPDWPEWLRMSALLFPDVACEPWMRGFLQRPEAALFVADLGDRLGGYLAVSSRLPFAPGPTRASFAYIEAWYVDTDCRRVGVGRALQDRAEQWAREQGFHELGADVVLDNMPSHRAHARMGYEEVETVVHYRKPVRR